MDINASEDAGTKRLWRMGTFGKPDVRRSVAWQVFVSDMVPVTEKLPANSVVFVANPNSWNDFGLKTDGRAYFWDGKEMSFSDAHFAFLSHSGDVRQFAMKLQQVVWNKSLRMISPDNSLFSMLASIQSYRSLVERFGLRVSKQVLGVINDVVLASTRRSSKTWVRKITSHEAFKYSFVRNSGGYFTFKNAGSILRGLTQERIDVVSRTIRLQFQSPAASSESSLEFSFDQETHLSRRIAVLIGANGAGKTQALSQLVRAALDGSKRLSGTDYERLVISRILAFEVGRQVSVYPKRRPNSKVDYRKFSISDSSTVGLAVSQLARSTDSIAGSDKWSIFLEALARVISLDEIGFEVDGGKSIKLLDLRQQEEQRRLEQGARVERSKRPVRMIGPKTEVPFSSGELAFITFAAHVCLEVENGSLLLFDEPETHLHPTLVSEFVGLLDALLERTGSVAIVATHSPYVVREVPRSQVHIIRRDGESVMIEAPRLRTFGASVSTISHFVFGDSLKSNLEEMIQRAGPDARKALLEDLEREGSNELWMRLVQ